MPYIKTIKKKKMENGLLITVIHMKEFGDEFPMYF